MKNKLQYLLQLAALRLLLIGMLISYSSILAGYAQNIFLPNYDTGKGLASNNCFYLTQDRDGFIWIATDAGVSRFDGKKFDNFSIDDGLPDNQIIQIKEDRRGRIWFLALNGQMSYFYHGKIHNGQNNSSLKSLTLKGTPISFAEDNLGNIWLGTNNNFIAQWNGNSTKIFTPSNQQDKYQKAYLYLDKDANINAVTHQAHYIFDGKKFIISPEIAAPINYRTIQYVKQSGLYWLENNQLKWNNGQVTVTLLSLDPSLNIEKLGYLNINQKTVWICSQNGVYSFQFPNLQRQYLVGISVNDSFVDRDGNTWFASTNGLYKLPKPSSRIQVFQHPHSFDLRSIALDNHQKLWLGNAQGTLDVWDLNMKQVTKQYAPIQTRNEAIKQLRYEPNNEHLYFASDFNLGRIRNTETNIPIVDLLTEKSKQSFAIKSFSIDTGSKIAIATSSGVLLLNGKTDLTFSTADYVENKNYFSGRSYRVFFDKAHQLWFSNNNGLNQFRYPTLFTPFSKHPILSQRINDIVQLANGQIAMATDGYGIVLLDGNAIRQVINQKNGLASNIIKKLYAYHNELWSLSNQGVNRLILSKNKVHIQTFNDLNDANDFLIHDLVFSRDTAYFASNKGLIYYPVQSFKATSKAPTVVITSLISNDQKLDIAQKRVLLLPGERNLIINYSAVDFDNQNLRYRYRLKQNRAWIETKNSRLEFSSLEPATYELEIAVKTADSPWSEPTVVQIVQRANFYETTWFRLMLFVLGGILVYRLTLNYSNKKRTKEQEELLLKNKIISLEQQALQAMMNPHFVFNVMNSLQHYINTQDNTKANKVLTGFAKLIRKNLDISAKGKITLAEEIDYLKLYLSLEQYRFGNKLHYHFALEPNLDLEETTLPTMLLQPFVENAIWHGIMPKDEGGSIRIHIEGTDYRLCITIEDDGIGIEKSLAQKKEGHHSKGLTLIKERILLLNKIADEQIELNIHQINPNDGTRVEIILSSKTI